ncbi:MAG TPA: hypothetical protein VI873_04390 [Candidatus Peribacteraceae bacterium]|nr:hypothetical protein [Candidatus Peribacteraceae bacterium]
MRKLFLFGCILALTGCSSERTQVFNYLGNVVGSVRIDDADHAMIFDVDLEPLGIVQGTVVRRSSGVAGQVLSHAIEDQKRQYRGTLEDDIDCYNETGKRVGRIGGKIDHEAAGGACLLLLLQ